MRTAIWLLLILGVFPLRRQERCDAACRALMTAAVEWTAARVPEEHRGPTRVDAGRTFLLSGEGTPEVRTSIPQEALGDLSVPFATAEEGRVVEDCVRDHRSARCRGIRGTTSLSIHSVEMASADSASVQVDMLLIDPSDRPGGFGSGSRRQLELQRSDGVWAVVSEQIIMSIN